MTFANFLYSSEESPGWTNAFANRLLLYRHDVTRDILKDPSKEKFVRYVGIMKASGMSYENGDGPVISIVVDKVRKPTSYSIPLGLIRC